MSEEHIRKTELQRGQKIVTTAVPDERCSRSRVPAAARACKRGSDSAIRLGCEFAPLVATAPGAN